MTVGDGADPIVPAAIDHHVEEILADNGTLEQIYNHLDYVFARDGARLICRCYLDVAWRVLILPPDRQTAKGHLRADVLVYLSRRFLLIEELGRDGYAPIWMALQLPRFRAWIERP